MSGKHRRKTLGKGRSVVAGTAVATGLIVGSAGAASASGHSHSQHGSAPVATAKPKASSSTSSPAAPLRARGFNEQDVAFLTHMIHHHGQALVMAKLAEKRAGTPAVHDLAHRITDAQQAEIDWMSAVLRRWGRAVPDPMEHAHGMPATGHGSGHGMSMPGMMTAHQMHALNQARGLRFERMWLAMMIEHHRGAVLMASMQVDHGKNRWVTRFALDVAHDQQHEIGFMHAQLHRLGG